MIVDRFSLKPIAAALLAACVVTGPVLADDGIKEDVTVVPGRQITPQDEAVISSAAVKILRHIAAARGDLHGDKPNIDQAKSELDQSDKLLDIIQASLPTTKVKDHIWVAKKHLEYENTREVLPDLVPIYSSLDELVDYVPTGTAKVHLDQAKKALQQGDKGKATEQLKQTDDALLFVEADLPLSATRNLVTQAKEKLAKGDGKAADKLLKSAEDNVVFISVSYQSPLIQAKSALWRATEDFRLQDKTKAKRDLAQAVNYLQQAAQSGDQITRQAAEKLVSEVRDLHQQIESGEQGLKDRIAGVWDRTRALSERSVEYISTGWQRMRSDDAGKRDLIEAKLQLAYARIDHFSSKDDAAAKVDLAEAKGYLDNAAEQVKTDIKPKIKEITDTVNQIETALQQDHQIGNDKLTFEQAESQLANLIRQI